MTTAWAWLALALAATAAGQLVYKHASMARSRKMTILAIVIFCLAPPASFLALRHLSLATVYVSTAISQLCVVLTSMALFHERYSRRQWTSLALILAGVIIFNSSALP